MKAGLHDLQILVQQKKQEKQEESAQNGAIILPGIQELMHKFVGLIDSHKDKVLAKLEELKGKEQEIKDELKKLKFGEFSCIWQVILISHTDLRWDLELGNCEFKLIDAGIIDKLMCSSSTENDPTGRPLGTMKIQHTRQTNKMIQRFQETETELINSKLSYAQSVDAGQQEANELRKKMREMEELLKKVQAERDSFEKQYVDTKLALAELGMRNADLERENFDLKNKKWRGKVD